MLARDYQRQLANHLNYEVQIRELTEQCHHLESTKATSPYNYSILELPLIKCSENWRRSRKSWQSREASRRDGEVRWVGDKKSRKRWSGGNGE